MKLTTIVLSSVLTLGSTLALAQGASSGDAAAAGGATGGPAGAGSSSAVKSDKMDPSGTRDSAQGSGSGNASATTAGGATGGPAGAGSSNATKSDTTGLIKRPRAPLTTKPGCVSAIPIRPGWEGMIAILACGAKARLIGLRSATRECFP